MRKAVIWVIATVFILEGIYRVAGLLLGSYLVPGLFGIRIYAGEPGGIGDITAWAMSIILLVAGVNLLILREFGRKLVVTLVWLCVGPLILLSIWGLIQGGLSIHIELSSVFYHQTDSPYVVLALSIVLLFLAVVLTIFLYQRKTKDLFK